jgi:sugar lactone lactonase YvrE
MERSRIVCEWDVALDARAQLGEGPRWDAASATLLWVDILGRAVHRFDPATGRDELRPAPDLVSLALPRAAGGVVVGLPDGLHLLEDGVFAPLLPVEADLPANRTNDAACDPQGRLWLGTMALDERSPTAALYRIDADLSLTTVLSGTTISNGLGWSPARDRFYFIDSPTMRIDVFDYDDASGEVEHRRELARVQVENAGPDGLAVDAEGCLWVALHGGFGLQRYAPDGALIGYVQLPVAKLTSCCFAGDGLKELYVTTRRQSLSARELAEQPLAGALLRLDPGVAGLPTYAFGGSSDGRLAPA